ncbi:MAG TPA: DUF389 domain-containing protein [Ilumatobacteraceae bacterium]|jgi:uncharacterized hydrophobic protein (TIGR00271 family)
MLHLSAFVKPDSTSAVCDGLSAIPGVRRVMIGSVTTDGFVNITAHLEAGSADAAIDLLAHHDVRADDVGLLRLPVLLPLLNRRGARDPDAQVWAEVVGRAWGNSHLRPTDLVFMIAAGVIAGVGVLTGSSILVVGAMAISPDLLPITASAVGLVEREWRLAARAGRSLVGGLSTSAVAACVAILILRATDRLGDDIALSESVLGESLTTLGPGTALVAIAAGVAGMLAYERLGGAAVGVAISVTTIPAAAYVGVGVALGRGTPVWGALLVLVTNVVLVVAASAATLWVQRTNQRRRSA